jgi:alpha-tubulin suppressor-like RCC1 family protein
LDRFGNLATGSPVTVRLVVGTSQWGSHLRGSTAVLSSGGVATFSGFSLDRPGTDVFLVAAVNGDTGFSGNFTRDTLPGLDEVAVGNSHACAARANAAFCWGSNEDGDLGNFSSLPDSVPVLVETPVPLTSLIVSDNFSCGLTAAGAAYCWGMDILTGQHDSTPIAVAPGLTFSKLAAGEIHTCGLTTAGDIYCWGSNFYGQLGDGRASGLTSPTPVLAAGGLTFTDLAANYLTTCAIASGGDAYCWGYGGYGQLGTGSTADDSVPTLVPGGLKFSQISLGFSTACGVTVDSLAYCWGANTLGALGDSTLASDSQPVAVHGGLKFNAVVTTGAEFSCGLAIDKEVWCWGLDGPSPYAVVPVDLGVTGDALSLGGRGACIVRIGVVNCWGSNSTFQMGNGTSIDVPSPQPIVNLAPRMRGSVRRQ